MKCSTVNHCRLSGAAKFLSSLLISLWISSVGAQGWLSGTSLTDVYWDPREPGWGVMAAHNGSVLFLSFLVYDANKKPYWVTATLAWGWDGFTDVVFTGDVYESSGPWFGGAFDSGTVALRKVGTARFKTGTFNYSTGAVLEYTIDGVPVQKTLVRLTLQELNFTGTYTGAMTYYSDCNGSQIPTKSITGPLTISRTGNNVTMVLEGATSTCTVTGAYRQYGTLGSVQGNLSCSDGTSGSGSVHTLQRSDLGVIGMLRFASSSSQCTITGAVSGISSFGR